MKTLRGAAAALLLVSAVAAAPALAQSGGSAGIGTARSKVGPPLPRTYPGGSIGSIGGPGWSNREGSSRRERCRMRGWCRDRWGYGYGYGGEHERMIAGGEFGYFNQEGDEPSMENGRPRYDYDRGYPYEHYRGERGMMMSEGPGDYGSRSRSCETERTHDRRSGRQVEVRVCRN